MTSKKYIFFGRIEVEMQAATGAGLVSTLVLQSNDLDEIDIEIVGNDSSHIQTNIFLRATKQITAMAVSRRLTTRLARVTDILLTGPRRS